ncbi:hypothetical protein GS682_17345 [Nostoc sp. B(2019)]|nr:hypothetical protein [Nostoc sp. B(2019)]
MPVLKSSVRLWRWRSHRYAGLTAQPFFQNGCLVSKGQSAEAAALTFRCGGLPLR